jgi:hypothetical protein
MLRYFSRRTILTGTATCAGTLAHGTVLPRPAAVIAQNASTEAPAPQSLPDMLDYIVKTLGPLRQAPRVGVEEALSYGRLANAVKKTRLLGHARDALTNGARIAGRPATGLDLG